MAGTAGIPAWQRRSSELAKFWRGLVGCGIPEGKGNTDGGAATGGAPERKGNPDGGAPIGSPDGGAAPAGR